MLELVVVLTIVGVLAGVVVPEASYFADRVAVEHQAARILSAYRSAWLTARMQQRLALLRVTADTLAIRTVLSAGAAETSARPPVGTSGARRLSLMARIVAASAPPVR